MDKNANKKFVISYINSKLNFNKTSKTDEINIRNLMINVRDEFNEWVSKFKNIEIDNKKIIEHFIWQNMSTWWINPLVRKDTEFENQWFYRILIILIIKKKKCSKIITDDCVLIDSIKNNFNTKIEINKIYNFRNYFKYLFFTPLFYYRFFRSFLKNLLIKFILYFINQKDYNIKGNKKNFFFLSLFPANWIIKNNNYICDRNLFNITDINKKNIHYFFFIKKYPKDKSTSYLSLIRNLNSYNFKKNKNIIFPEKKISIIDIFNVYYSSLREYYKFQYLAKNKEFRKNFIFMSLDIFNILRDEWISGYYELNQNIKLQGIATQKYFSNFSNRNYLITYNELFIESRAQYHLIHKKKISCKFIALQHSLNTKNYGEVFNHKFDFTNNHDYEGIEYCPSPDYYLVQGFQYYNLLNTFYDKNKIKIVGSLRIDKYLNNTNSKEKIDKYLKDNNIIKDKFILIAPSSNDFDNIYNFIENIKVPNNWKIVISPHPSYNNSSYWDENINIKNKDNFLINYKYSTIELLKFSKLVICCYSNIAFESLLFGCIPIRVIPLGYFPPRESDSRIIEFYNITKFHKWINNIDNNIKSYDLSYSNKFLEEYYYKIDNKTKNRIWNFIDNI